MNASIKNFVSLTHQSNDLLSPIEYRTILDMIQGILSNYDFKRLDGSLKLLHKHLIDFDDPHEVRNLSFYNEIVERTYAIYVNMLASPLSLADFKTQIAPTLSFVELFRRIVLNRYLYDQVKTNTGSVPSSASAFLSADWGLSETDPSPVVLNFGSSIGSEVDFIRKGWNGNTSPVPAIFTAEFLSQAKVNLPIVFETSSDSTTTRKSSTGDQVPVALELASNDVTVTVEYTGTPLSDTKLLSLKNTVDDLELVMRTDKRISLLANKQEIIKTASPSSDGKIVLIIDKQGFLSLQSTTRMSTVRTDKRFVFKDDAPLNSTSIIAPYQDLFSTQFGLKNVTIYRGREIPFPFPGIAVPPGYSLLVDSNGSYLCDSDGAPLIDLNLDLDVSDLDDFIFYVDRDGSYLTDRDGAFVVSLSFRIPEGFLLLVDDDGSFLKDDDGNYLVEFDSSLLPAGYALVIDDAGRIVMTDEGVYLINRYS